jgi:hypothetical protein
MTFNRDDPNTWPYCRPLIMAHDVGRSRDSSTAVIGGNCPVGPRSLGIKELEELPKGLYGSSRASALAAIDRRYNNNALIVGPFPARRLYVHSLSGSYDKTCRGNEPGRTEESQEVQGRSRQRGFARTKVRIPVTFWSTIRVWQSPLRDRRLSDRDALNGSAAVPTLRLNPSELRALLRRSDTCFDRVRRR